MGIKTLSFFSSGPDWTEQAIQKACTAEVVATSSDDHQRVPPGTRSPAVRHLSLLFLGAFSLLLLLPIGVEAAKPLCGDGKCAGGETSATCPADCGAPSGVCGDGICNVDESCSTCAQDCGVCPPASCNNDGICNAGEDCINCPGDCAGVTGGKPNLRYCCGADTCSATLCGPSCGSLSQTVCGNGILESGEECDDGNLVSGDGCSLLCTIETASAAVPANQFNVGDSIGEGEASDGTVGEPHHETVWSTGYLGSDVVNSLNERLEAQNAAAYYENNSTRDTTFNRAISGSVMADFADQALEIVGAAASGVPTASAGMVTVLLGNNDVCADTLDGMTDPATFETQFRAGLDILAASPSTKSAAIHVSGIPAIYWLWEAKRSDFWCRAFAWPFVPCQNLLGNPADDCVSAESRLNPDVIYDGDGLNCQRRKQFHARIRDEYNPILKNVLGEYRASAVLPNAKFVDVLDVRFGSMHVNGGDCFHPSAAGHALLAEKQWCRTPWGANDPLCTP
jgi:cysteine-rich repeat protein